MNRQNDKKLNLLLTQWQPGSVLTTLWLRNHGYYGQLVKLYCDNGWIQSVGPGAYLRLNDKLTWQGAVQALQLQLEIPVHVGGLTALELYGISQYATLNAHSPSFYLYNSENKNTRLPQWFRKSFTNCHLLNKKLFDEKIGITKREFDGIELAISAPERSAIEVLALVPNQITLSHANELFEGLDRLRSPLVQSLLEACHSIKLKRLFLYLAEKNALSCFKELDLTRIDLGSGNRVIGEGGAYNARWLLSLPKPNELMELSKKDDE